MKLSRLYGLDGDLVKKRETKTIEDKVYETKVMLGKVIAS